MAEGPKTVGLTIEIKPHAYDPAVSPELFDGVLTRRFCAFLVDLLILAVPASLAALFIFLFGLVTFGLGWVLFFVFYPLTIVWALLYYGFCFAHPASATLGMQLMDLEMRTWYGAPTYFLLGAVHAVVYWVSVSVLTPLITLVGFFNSRHRLLHDMICGTVVINNDTRAATLRRRSPA